MIHDVGQNLLVQLQVRGCPIPVVDGPELRPTTTFARERIVIEHDEEHEADSYGPRHKADYNPRTRLTRAVGVKVTIYAQNPSKGSLYWEHVRRAEYVLDQVLIGLDVVAKVRGNLVVFKSGRFVRPDDFKGSETPGGAVYELFLTFDRAVMDRKWDLTIEPTAVISPQMIGGPSLAFSASAHTITRSFGSWLSDRFSVGGAILCSDTASNNGALGVITELTDTVMTFATGLVDETALTAMITGDAILVSNTTTVTNPSGSETLAG